MDGWVAVLIDAAADILACYHCKLYWGGEQDTKCMAIIKVIMFIAANDIGGREKPGYHT